MTIPMKRLLRFALFALLACVPGISIPALARAQATPERPRVFLDCQDTAQLYCDFDFFRTEITWVDYVRDRADADVHVLVTTQTTGSGGNEFTIALIGQRALARLADTLRSTSKPSATRDEVRRGLERTIALGLVRYVASSGVADRLRITYTAPDAKAEGASAAGRDRWNNWVFRTSLNLNVDGEKTYTSSRYYGTFSANRTTEAWKINLSLNEQYNESRFEVSDTRTITNVSRDYGVNGLVVKSLTAHWSTGVQGSAERSTFLNQRYAIRVAPALEYNVFPYAESTRRQFTLRYGPGVNAFRYDQETIFDKRSETRFDQTLTASLDLKQPWGSISSSLEGASYLHDFSKRRLVFFNSFQVRLFKGLSINSFGSVSLLHDQLYLPRTGVTEEEVLLRRRQLETSYRYFAGFGLSYTFGSIFNNVVNPRFGGSSGGFFFF